MKAKIKLTPIRSQSLCEKCRWGLTEECMQYLFASPLEEDCDACPNFDCETRDCQCFLVEDGEPCPFFIRKDDRRTSCVEITEEKIELMTSIISALQSYGIATQARMALTDYKSQLISNRELAETILDKLELFVC